MSLLDSEVMAIRAELGFNVLTIGAMPYVGYTSLFDQIIQPYTQGGAVTSCSTSVTAATTATPVTLTLASATGFAALDRVVVDVDDLQEIATIRSVSGSTISVVLSLAHSGTYPVVVEGGESQIRDCLRRLRDIKNRLLSAAKTAGLKRAEDLEWYPNAVAVGLFSQRNAARGELADMLGLGDMWRAKRGAGQTVSPY